MVAVEALVGKDLMSSCQLLGLSLASIGAVTLSFFACTLLLLIYRIFIPGTNINQFLKGDRPAWAIVTGPTSGIGKSYAIALAKKGFNLILVSRSKGKLEALQSEINEKFPNCEIRLVDVDMAVSPLGQKYAQTLNEVAKNGDIRVLINNAGMSHDVPVTFDDTSKEEMEGIVGVNVGGVLHATKEALPYLLSDPKKKRLIVNVGSFAAYAPTPLLATYSGTKAFVSAWSRATKAELASKNIVVQYLNAYLVTTKLAKIRRPSPLVPTEDAFVRAALHNIGRDGSPYWSHAVCEWILAYPVMLVGGREGCVVAWVNKRMHEGIRRRALKKASKAK